jgi:hypothetical protein
VAGYDLTVARIDAIAAVPAEAWNALDQGGVPFLRHEFLAALEATGDVSSATGWTPRHLVAYSGHRLVGALPLYEKTHSFGEFVFDFGWASAYARHGLAYYPKLVSATPFTPATGRRFLIAPDLDRAVVRDRLLDAALEATEQNASSWHVEFTTEAEAAELRARGLLYRTDCQFLWKNAGFSTFDDFLATFNAEKRKKAKRERRRVVEDGIRFEWRPGHTLDPDEWQVVHALTATTFLRRGSSPYLSAETFVRLSACPATEPQVLLARLASQVVACAIFFRGDDTLYGRYWGAAGDFHSLHFETCYHQGVEYCIREGLARFEPGTQGEHKVARGFAPTLTYSCHHILDPRFRDAIARHLEAERADVARYAAAVGEHVPFRREAREIEALD